MHGHRQVPSLDLIIGASRASTERPLPEEKLDEDEELLEDPDEEEDDIDDEEEDLDEDEETNCVVCMRIDCCRMVNAEYITSRRLILP